MEPPIGYEDTTPSSSGFQWHSLFRPFLGTPKLASTITPISPDSSSDIRLSTTVSSGSYLSSFLRPFQRPSKTVTPDPASENTISLPTTTSSDGYFPSFLRPFLGPSKTVTPGPASENTISLPTTTSSDGYLPSFLRPFQGPPSELTKTTTPMTSTVPIDFSPGDKIDWTQISILIVATIVSLAIIILIFVLLRRRKKRMQNTVQQSSVTSGNEEGLDEVVSVANNVEYTTDNVVFTMNTMRQRKPTSQKFSID